MPPPLNAPANTSTQPATAAPAPLGVLQWSEARQGDLRSLLSRFGIEIQECAEEAPIPGSFWGEPEAGLVGRQVFVRADTPVHSLLHESCHYICMDPDRRAALHTDAGGDYAEEDAVCYLQILLADAVPGLGRGRMMADMDAWGYTFRLGSARSWFESDAAEARDWLRHHGIIDGSGRATWSVRRG